MDQPARVQDPEDIAPDISGGASGLPREEAAQERERVVIQRGGRPGDERWDLLLSNHPQG